MSSADPALSAAAQEAVPLPPFPVRLTPHAGDMVQQALRDESLEGHALRVGVVGGGCSGLEVQLDFSEAPVHDDWTDAQHGVSICVDPYSANFLRGTTIDHVDGLEESGFKVDNPNIVRQCGCGKSFSV